MLHTTARVFLTLLCTAAMAALSIDVEAREPHGPALLQEMVDRLKGELGIEAGVDAVIVAANPLLVSVQPTADGRFHMAFEERFLADIDASELRAIVAHELGHVWIFTHHPYLQTERLANAVAMRAVSREHLARVYSKVWDRAGKKGDLARFLGPR